MAEPGSKPKSKGASLYTVINAQAGGIADAVSRGLFGEKLEDFKDFVDDALEWEKTLCADSLTKEDKGKLGEFKDEVYNNIISNMKRHIDAYLAGLGLGAGTALMGLEESFMGTPQLLSIYLTERFDASVRPRIERYWRTQYSPSLPNAFTSFKLLMEGQISRKEFNKFLSYEGWASGWHDKLYEIFNREPDIRMAFDMKQRGLIDEDEMQACFRIAGFDSSWDEALYSVLYRVPTLRELNLISDYVPLDSIWMAQTLRAQGYRDSDINYIIPALQLKPLREEIRSVLGRYLWQYQIGRLDRDTLKENMNKLGLLANERGLWLLWADLRYADELLDEQIAILEERCIQGDITTKEDALAELVALGILEEKANLMAELWYWKYMP